VGLDVHARSIVGCGLDVVTGQVLQRRLVPTAEAVRDWSGQLPGPVAVAYEAGPTGFGLARQLRTDGVRGAVCGGGAVEAGPAGGRSGQDRPVI
jgi:hypothetical protein